MRGRLRDPPPWRRRQSITHSDLGRGPCLPGGEKLLGRLGGPAPPFRTDWSSRSCCGCHRGVLAVQQMLLLVLGGEHVSHHDVVSFWLLTVETRGTACPAGGVFHPQAPGGGACVVHKAPPGGGTAGGVHPNVSACPSVSWIPSVQEVLRRQSCRADQHQGGVTCAHLKILMAPLFSQLWAFQTDGI